MMNLNVSKPAAFGRLCVETLKSSDTFVKPEQPPSGGCVLKHKTVNSFLGNRSAAFGRLCVETGFRPGTL